MECAAEMSDTLLHSEKAETAFDFRVKAAAVILDSEVEAVRYLPDGDTHGCCMGMADGVMQGFLDDAVDTSLVFFREIFRDPFRGDVHGDARGPRNLTSLPLERGYKTQVVEHGRPEKKSDVADDSDTGF